MLVDVPGYGYAKMSKSSLEKLGHMMDEYFNEREQIKCVVQLIDARHDPTKDDKEMIDFLKKYRFLLSLLRLRSIKYLRQNE